MKVKLVGVMGAIKKNSARHVEFPASGPFLHETEKYKVSNRKKGILKVTGKTMQEGSDGRAGLDSAGISLI